MIWWLREICLINFHKEVVGRTSNLDSKWQQQMVSYEDKPENPCFQICLQYTAACRFPNCESDTKKSTKTHFFDIASPERGVQYFIYSQKTPMPTHIEPRSKYRRAAACNPPVGWMQTCSTHNIPPPALSFSGSPVDCCPLLAMHWPNILGVESWCGGSDVDKWDRGVSNDPMGLGGAGV